VDRRYRFSLFIEVWLVLLLYGGGVLNDLPRLAACGVAAVRLAGRSRSHHVRSLAAPRRDGAAPPPRARESTKYDSRQPLGAWRPHSTTQQARPRAPTGGL
jgi:hypothetical protein